MEYIITGIFILLMSACFIAPLVFDAMSQEDLEAVGLAWPKNNN